MEKEGGECSVKVAIQVRPLIGKELSEGCEECIFVRKDEPDVVLARGSQQSYGFDFVFGSNGRPSSSIYDTCAKPLVQEVLKGFNATVLAYGQTGSGKTYTMGTGYPVENEDGGIVPRAVREIFSELSKLEKGRWRTSVSFVELFREEIRDLLGAHQSGSTNLPLREIQGRGVYIAGAVEKEVHNASDVEACLKEGSQSRATASTQMNLSSSRSHAILTLNLEQTMDDDEGNSGQTLRSKFHLVDLAGSERVKRTKAEGQRFQEGVSINKGLLALGKVISALVDSSGSNSSMHIPYRDSKLTRLLQDSLGGNSRTMMIACVSPADVNLDETINTLKYAARARRIRNRIVLNLDKDNREAEVSSLRRQLQAAREEIALLRASNEGALREELMLRKSENRKLRADLGRLTVRMAEAEASQTGIDAVENGEDENEWITDMDSDSSAVEESEDGSGEDCRLEGGYRSRLTPRNARRSTESGDSSSGSSSSGSGSGRDTDADHIDPKLHKEMEELEEELLEKQQQMQKMEEVVGRAADLQANYEKHVEVLEAEKEKLREKLKDIEKTKDAARQEDRSKYTKRLKELESRISTLRFQLKETEKLRRQREGAEQQRLRLQEDISRIKQQRVTLAKQIEVSAKTHREEVRTKNHEIAQLKKQDLKKTLRVRHLEQKEQQVKAILVRKNQETDVVKKRLKDAMARLEGRLKSHGPKSKPARPSRSSQSLKRQLEIHIEAKQEIKELRNMVEVEQNERAVRAKEAAEARDKDQDDGDLQISISRHSARIREAQSRLVELQSKHEGTKAEMERWGYLRSTTDAVATLRMVFDMVVESRVAMAKLQDDLHSKSSELELAMMRLHVEESARTAREQQHSSIEPTPERTPTRTVPQLRTPDGMRIPNGSQWEESPQAGSTANSRREAVYLEDEPESDADVGEIPYDDKNDPEWSLKDAAPFRARPRKRSGSNSTAGSAASRDVLNSKGSGRQIEPAYEERVLTAMNKERQHEDLSPIKRLTVSHLKSFLKGRVVNGVLYRVLGKDKFALLSDALAVVDGKPLLEGGENQNPNESRSSMLEEDVPDHNEEELRESVLVPVQTQW